MPKVVLTCKVEDVAKWKTFDDERNESLGKFATNIQSHIDIDRSNTVALTMDLHDEEGFYAMHNLDDGDPKMKQQGIIRPVMIMSA